MLAIQHARLRAIILQNIIESIACVCGEIKDTYHYTFTCPLYDSQQSRLFDVVRHIARIDLNTVLFDNNSLSDDAI